MSDQTPIAPSALPASEFQGGAANASQKATALASSSVMINGMRAKVVITAFQRLYSILKGEADLLLEQRVQRSREPDVFLTALVRPLVGKLDCAEGK
jgi:hypothetical protein